MSTKKILSILFCMMLLFSFIPASTIAAPPPAKDKFNVTFDIDDRWMTKKVLYVTIQNLQDSSDTLDFSTIINRTDFSINGITNVEIYQWNNISHPYMRTIYNISYVNRTEYNETNQSWHNWTEEVRTAVGEELVENYYFDWDRRSLISKTEDSLKGELKHYWENIPIQKYGQEKDTVKFKFVFHHPIVRRSDGGWGSRGVVWLDLNGQTYVDFSNSSWWDTRWNYRTSSEVSSPEHPYQYSLNVSSGSGANNKTHVFLNGKNSTNFDDIRFILNDATELAYWIEDNTTDPIKVWVNVTGNGTVYLYYGNPDAVSASDGDATFEFFDDFLGTSLDANKWDSDGFGSYSGIFFSVNDSILSIWSDDTWRILRMIKSFAPTDKVIVETKFKTDDASVWLQNFLVQETDIVRNRFGLRDNGSLGWQVQYRMDGGDWVHSPVLHTLTAGVWYIDAIQKQSPDTFKAIIYDLAYNQLGDAFAHTSSLWEDETWTWVTWKDKAIKSHYDWIHVRKYASPEPQWGTWSAEEVVASTEISPTLIVVFTDEIFSITGTITLTSGDDFYGDADLLKDDQIVKTTKSIVNNVTFTLSEESRGVYKYAVRFYNGTHYTFNYTTPNCIVSASDAITRRVVRTSEGYLHYVHSSYDTGTKTYRIYYARSLDNGDTWEEKVLTDGEVNSTFPSIAVDSNDNLHIVYVTENDIKYKKLTGIVWHSEEVISSDGGITPTVTVDGTDTLYIAWTITPSNSSQPSAVKFKYYDGISWSDEIIVENASTDVIFRKPTIATDSNNFLHTVYVALNSSTGNGSIKYAKYSKNESLSSRELFSNSSYDTNNPSVAVDLNDNIHVAWEYDRSIKYRKYNVTSTSWEAVEVICDGSDYAQWTPTVSVSGTDCIHIIWSGKTSTYSDNWIIREKCWSGSWSTISDIIHPTGKNATYPSAISSLYPKICGDNYIDIPETGYSFIYNEEDVVKYYNASTWRYPDKYVIVVKAKNAKTAEDILNFTATLSTGETKNTEYGVVKFRGLGSGYYSVTVVASNYYSSVRSITLDQTKEAIIFLTFVEEPSHYLPRARVVEFMVVNASAFGNPVPDVDVTAVGVEITGKWNWLYKYFGFEEETYQEISNTTMNGTTDPTGSVSFLMVDSIKYKMTFVKESDNINETIYIYPKEDYYKIIIGTKKWVETTSQWDFLNYSILVTDIPGNDTHAYINFSFVDANNATTKVYYYINQTNGTTSFNIYNCTYTGSNCTNITNSYAVKRGEAYLIGFVAENNDYGEVKHSILIRIFEKARRLLDFGEDVPDYIYDYISIGLLCLVAAFFGVVTVPEGGIVISLQSWILWYIGWFGFGVALMPLYLTVVTVFAILITYSAKGRQKGVS